jgi:hypothetical protein
MLVYVAFALEKRGEKRQKDVNDEITKQLVLGRRVGERRDSAITTPNIMALVNCILGNLRR